MRLKSKMNEEVCARSRFGEDKCVLLVHQLTPPEQKVVTLLGCKNLQITPLGGTSVDFMPSWVSLESLLEGEKVVKLIQRPPLLAKTSIHEGASWGGD